MQTYENITGGLNIPSQIPLNVKEYCINESTLAYLGIDNNLAFTYIDGIKIFCQEERTIYEWREVQTGEENTGLIPLDFTYPSMPPIFNVDYSNKTYNFFKLEYAVLDNIKEIVCLDGTVDIVETDTQIQLAVEPTIANGSSTKIINGLQIVVTGTGTTLDPYKIDGKLYQSGTGITITGAGTSLSPYVISINNTNGNIGWLKGDTKEVVCDKLYLGSNFDGSGLGINERVGWAIMNGATHIYNGQTITVPDDTGLVVVGYGNQLDYDDPETTGGEEKHQLSISEMPKHKHVISQTEDISSFGSRSTGGGTPGGADIWDNFTSLTGGLSGGTEGSCEAHNNMQPYVVRLRIMKL